MVVQLDNFSPDQKRVYVITTCTIGLVLSNVTFALRVWAKLITIKKVHLEDWVMLVGLLLSYAVAVCMFYGLTVGLGQHQVNVSDADVTKFRLSLWVLQRFQPPTLLCIKTSLILFYVRLFPSKKFRLAGWIIFGFTLFWACGAWLASLLECNPVSFFWDKSIKGGTCVPNPLITVGLTSGVVSCLNDILIFAMPIPVLAKLHMNAKKKIALMGVFALGIFVICTSFVRWIALLGTATDVTYNQVEAGIWTYMEISIGITCANLPLLAPVLKKCLGNRGLDSSDYAGSKQLSQSRVNTKQATKKSTIYDGFTRMDESPSGSEVELRERDKQANILVQREVNVQHHDEEWAQDRELGLGKSTVTASAYTKEARNL